MKPAIELTDNLEQTLDERPHLVRVFFDRRMACPGCPMARFEVVADAADAYQIPHDEWLAALREADAEA